MLNGTVKKSTGIRKDVRLGKLRYNSEFIAIKFSMKQRTGVLIGCVNSSKYQELPIISG